MIGIFLSGQKQIYFGNKKILHPLKGRKTLLPRFHPFWSIDPL